LLLSYGIEEENIKVCATTGLVVDIKGTGPEDTKSDSNGVKAVALRTDLDALPIPEKNEHLPYKTVTNCAHMCGHDGHMTTLMAAA
jgi:hippurate hydrolase